LIHRQSLLATFFAFHLVVCLGVPLFHAWREGSLRGSWREAWGIARFSPSGILLGLASGLVLLVSIAAGFWLLLQSSLDAGWIRLT
ncbi:hypothetical protein MXD63_45310, partial [Frankia sp. Cpl3]|nr:hypothetical protein [Frankia sp. Cpl3]